MPEPELKTLGGRIYAIRTAGKMSQAALGKVCSVDQSTISKYEKDEIVPASDTLQKMAAHFKVPMEYFLGLYTPGYTEPPRQAKDSPNSGVAPDAGPGLQVLLGQMSAALEGLLTDRTRLVTMLERGQQRLELMIERGEQERHEWRELMQRVLDKLPAANDELETLRAENSALRGKLSAPPGPGSGGAIAAG